MLREVHAAAFAWRSERISPMPHYAPRVALCKVCGGEFVKTNASVITCGRECREKRLAEIAEAAKLRLRAQRKARRI